MQNKYKQAFFSNHKNILTKVLLLNCYQVFQIFTILLGFNCTYVLFTILHHWTQSAKPIALVKQECFSVKSINNYELVYLEIISFSIQALMNM